jgi:hypothetical protein
VDKWKKGQIDLNKYVFDSRWIEIVRLGAADLGSAAKRGRYEATEFVKAILNVEDDFEEAKRLLILAGYIVSDDVKLEPSIENRILDDLFNEYLNTDYEELKNLISRVIKELLRSEKRKVISERIKELAKNENVRAVELLELIDVEEYLPILSKLAKSKMVEVRRVVAYTINMMLILHHLRIALTNKHIEKLEKTLNNLIEEKDLSASFNVINALDALSRTQNIKCPNKLRESRGFRKYSLFAPFKHHLIVDESISDNDPKISEIATQIKRHELYYASGSSLFYPYPTRIFGSKDILVILATNPNSELDYLEFKKPIKDVLAAIETIKKIDFAEENFVIREFSHLLNTKLVIENFEKTVNKFKGDLSILVSIADGLKFFIDSKSILENGLRKNIDIPLFPKPPFPKTKDPRIKLLISYLLNEEPDEGLIRKGIEIYREDKDDKNKKALFMMLYHFLNPFAGGFS